jgi:glycosidase
MSKIIVYQLFPRLFGNTKAICVPNGSLQENGVGKFDDITLTAITAIKRLNVSHIWLTGILEHASTTDYSAFGIASVEHSLVKGKAGSPYAVRDYYDVSPDLANDVPNRMSEFIRLVERCHSLGLEVIIDFVPNHLFRQYASDAKPEKVVDFGAYDTPTIPFSPQNNFYYLPQTHFISPVKGAYKEVPARATGNNYFLPHPTPDDWYETVKLNYGIDYLNKNTAHFDPVPDTWHKMLDVLTFWADKGVDGFRCDMIEMVPVAFWVWVIPQMKAQKRLTFIAEIYKPEFYRDYLKSGFDYLYDKVGLYDTLKKVSRGDRPASDISHCWQCLGDLQPVMLNFLENHDEQRIASDFFLGNPLRALPALVVSACLNTAPFMLYSGQEFGERGMDVEGFSTLDGRTSIFDYWSVDTLKRFNNNGQFHAALLSDSEKEVYNLYIKFFTLLSSSPAITSGATYDLVYANMFHDHFNSDKHFAFLRHAKTPSEETLLIAVNFCDHPADLRIRIPEHAFQYLHIPNNVLLPDCVLFGSEDSIERTGMPLLGNTNPFPIHLSAYGAVVIRFHPFIPTQ